MDPQLTSDGVPYGPIRYSEITRERYLISKKCNTSYNDVGNITPLERSYLIKFIIDEHQKEQEKLQEYQDSLNS